MSLEIVKEVVSELCALPAEELLKLIQETENSDQRCILCKHCQVDFKRHICIRTIDVEEVQPEFTCDKFEYYEEAE